MPTPPTIVALLGRLPDWPDAACRGTTVDFFPTIIGGRGRALRDRVEAPAKAICARCPRIDDCRALAVSRGERYGIWGGMNTDERRRWAREQRRSA